MKSHFTTPVLIAALLAAMATGCTKHSYTTEDKHIPGAVEFSTQIALTRAYDNLWEYGDTIGVYMVPSPQPPADETDEGTDDGTGTNDGTDTGTGTDDGTGSGTAPTGWRALDAGDIRANMAYSTDLAEGAAVKSVAFTGADEQNTLSWPNDGSAVDFVAYYPRVPHDSITDFVYPVRLAGQNPQRAIDLMWSNNLRGVSADDGESTLTFRHMLTKLVFNVVDTNGASLEGMTATIDGLPSRAGFDISTGTLTIEEPETPEEPEDSETPDGPEGPEDTEEEDDGIDSEPSFEPFDAVLTACSDANEDGVKERAVAEAIVLPGEALDYDVTFTLASGEKAVYKLEDVAYDAGKRYIYNLKLQAAAGKVEFHNADEVESIDMWEDETVNVTDPIIKEPDGGEGEEDKEPEEPLGNSWSSGPISDVSPYFDLHNDGMGEYKSEGYEFLSASTVTVTMSSFKGDISSIGVKAEYTGSIMGSAGTISVNVNGTPLSTDGKTTTEVHITKDSSGEFIFVTPNGQPIKGEITIEILASYSNILLREFTINPNL